MATVATATLQHGPVDGVIHHLGEPVQSLHFVGFTDDHDGLILATEAGGQGRFVVPVDSGLLEQLAEGLALTAGAEAAPVADPTPPPPTTSKVTAATKVDSALSPREVQARLRTGATLAEVAAAAGVDEAWVERFAAPVFAEQAAAVTRAASIPMSKQRRGTSQRPLGDAVPRVLAEKGVRLTEEQLSEGWAAYQLHAAQWVVSFSYRWRGRPHRAEWAVDLSARTVVSRNRTASELGWVDVPEDERADEAPGGQSRVGRAPTRPMTLPTAAQDAPTPSAAAAVDHALAGEAAAAEKVAARRAAAAAKVAARQAAAAERAVARQAAAAEKAVAREVAAAEKVAARKAVAARKEAARNDVAANNEAARKAAERRAVAAERAASRAIAAAQRGADKKVAQAEKAAARQAAGARRDAERRAVAAEKAAARKAVARRPAGDSAGPLVEGARQTVTEQIAAAERAVAQRLAVAAHSAVVHPAGPGAGPGADAHGSNGAVPAQQATATRGGPPAAASKRRSARPVDAGRARSTADLPLPEAPHTPVGEARPILAFADPPHGSNGETLPAAVTGPPGAPRSQLGPAAQGAGVPDPPVVNGSEPRPLPSVLAYQRTIPPRAEPSPWTQPGTRPASQPTGGPTPVPAQDDRGGQEAGTGGTAAPVEAGAGARRRPLRPLRSRQEATAVAARRSRPLVSPARAAADTAHAPVTTPAPPVPPEGTGPRHDAATPGIPPAAPSIRAATAADAPTPATLRGQPEPPGSVPAAPTPGPVDAPVAAVRATPAAPNVGRFRSWRNRRNART